MFTKPDLIAAEGIMGWQSHNNLMWLAKQARKHSKIVEIGTFVGRSARALADNTPGVVYTVDDFIGPRDIGLPDCVRDNVFELFVASSRDLLASGKLRVIVAKHAEAEVNFSPDMVFLDGSHEYNDVKRDITKWLPQLTKGGLLCGDDFTNMAPVREAVKELLPRFKLARGTSIWYTRA